MLTRRKPTAHRASPISSLIAATVLVLTVVACGGGDKATGPKYPNVAGTYTLTGTFDAVPTAIFSGPITLVQADRSTGALTGTATITLGGDLSGTVTGLSQASVTQDGHVVFMIGSTTNGATWTFTGQISGSAGSGRHTLASTTNGSFSGPWSVTK